MELPSLKVQLRLAEIVQVVQLAQAAHTATETANTVKQEQLKQRNKEAAIELLRAMQARLERSQVIRVERS